MWTHEGVKMQACMHQDLYSHSYACIEHNGSGVELRTLNYENPGANPGCGVKTLGKFLYSTMLQFTELNK